MALDFDGIDDFVSHGDIPGIDLATNFSIAWWMNIDALNTAEGIADKGGGIAAYLIRSHGATATTIHAYFGGADSQAATQLETGVWHYYAYAYDGGGVGDANRLRYYRDGAQVTLTYNVAVPAALGDAGAGVVEWGGNAGAGGFMDMRVALAKLWPGRTLTAAEIAQEYNSFRPTVTANLSLWSPYDDGTSARDYSGAGNHGTVTGALAGPGPPVGYGGHGRRLLMPALLGAMASGAMTRREFLRRTAGAVPLLGGR